jgi:hypothetical protein
MKHFTLSVAAFIVAAAVSGAAAQDLASAAPKPGPRVEVGAGAAWYVDLNQDAPIAFADTRATVRVARNWDLEGAFNFRSFEQGLGGIYRIQARWRLPVRSADGSLQAHLAFGGAGFISRWSIPAYDYENYITHEMQHQPAASGWNVDAPMYPTVAFGVQKVLGAHLAIRADLNVGFGAGDYGISAVLLPTVGVSIPIGRYPSAGKH